MYPSCQLNDNKRNSWVKLFTHIARLMTGVYNKRIHICCLPCNYVTKSFGILQRLIKSQKVLTLFEHSKSRYLSSQKNLWLNFQTCF